MQSRTVTERFKTAPWAVEAVFSEERGLFQFHGKCERPHEIYVRGLPDKLLVSLGREAQTPVVGSMLVRCRKCAPCLEHRSTLWAARACTEVSLAPSVTILVTDRPTPRPEQDPAEQLARLVPLPGGPFCVSKRGAEHRQARIPLREAQT